MQEKKKVTLLSVCSIRLQQEGRTHVVPRGGEDYRGGDQEQRTDCSGGEVREERRSFVFVCGVLTQIS